MELITGDIQILRYPSSLTPNDINKTVLCRGVERNVSRTTFPVWNGSWEKIQEARSNRAQISHNSTTALCDVMDHCNNNKAPRSWELNYEAKQH